MVCTQQYVIYECEQGHRSQIPAWHAASGSIRLQRRVLDEIISAVRDITSPDSSSRPTVEDYLSFLTKRAENGLTHLSKSLQCSHEHCTLNTHPSYFRTSWPRILRVNPRETLITDDSPTFPTQLSLARGPAPLIGDITYSLIGSIRYHPDLSHWTVRLLLGNRTYSCDGIVNNGGLVDIGSGDILEEPDELAKEYFYVRTSAQQVSVFYSITGLFLKIFCLKH